jgi:hypothetical protein
MALMYLACMSCHPQPWMVPNANMSGVKSSRRCFFPHRSLPQSHRSGGLPIREKLRSALILVFAVCSAHTNTRVVIHLRPGHQCPSIPPSTSASPCLYDSHQGTPTIHWVGSMGTAYESGSKPALPHESCPTLLRGGLFCRRPATAPLPCSADTASFTSCDDP